jgi:hypothetical protein
MTRAEPEFLPERPWSAPVAADEVPDTGRHLELAADDRTRAAVAKLAGVPALPRLQATFDVNPYGRRGLHVVGRVSATVGQMCIVTLEPMETEVEEVIDIIFTPQAAAAVTKDDGDGSGVEIAAEDGPEPLVDGVVDLGALATEFLILGIDPYPRRPDAVFEPPAVGDDSGHPFAALAALKKGQGQR